MRGVLICMRLNGTEAYSETFAAACSQCGEPVGVDPARQQVLRRTNAAVICDVCYRASNAFLMASER